METKELVILITLAIGVSLVILGLILNLKFGNTTPSQPSQDILSPTTETIPITETPEFLIYNNPAKKIRIKYLSDWEKNSQIPGSIVIFSSPKASATDTSAAFGITIEDLSAQPMTLEQYTKFSLEMIKQIPNFELLDSSKATLEGKPAHKVIYAMKVGQYNIKNMVVYTIKDDTAYVLTYTGEISKYNHYLDTAQEMISSFEII